MNYFRVQARLIINFNSNRVAPRHMTTSLLQPYYLHSNVEIRLILVFIFRKPPVNATISFLRLGFYGPKVVTLTGFHYLLYDFRFSQ